MQYRIPPLILAALAAGLVLLPGASPVGAFDDTPGPEDVQPGVEVQARGAVHEAYAEPNRGQAAAGPLVAKEPPARVQEAPPEEKPEGDNVVWIPGYWSWDEETSNFVWISGFWRAVPPGRNWVPGGWQKADGGFRWVSGYWGAAAQEETEYLPPPPASIDNGPSTPAPGDNYNYVPGNWVYQRRSYLWRPGYWLAYRPGWCWTPACYRWTPCGYVYVSGYWDMPLLDRGMLFAPVCFTRPVFLTPGFIYRPAYCIQPDFLCGALFVRRGFGGGYCFGDYFGPRYRTGFTAWSSFRFGGGVGLDLNFGYYRNAFRGYPAWERGLDNLYAGRFAGTIAAPPRTLIQQKTVVNNITINRTTNNIVNKHVNITNVQNVSVLAPVKKVNKVNVTALSSLAGTSAGAKPPAAVSRDVRVTRLNAAQLAQEKQQVARLNAIARERKATEARLVAKAPTAPTAAPLKARLDLPKGTPPARVIKHTAVPPSAPKADHRPVAKPAIVKPTTPTTPAPKPTTPAAKPTTPTAPAPRPTAPSATTPPATKPMPKPMPTVPAPRPTKPAPSGTTTPSPRPMPKPMPTPGGATTPTPRPMPTTPAPKSTTPAPRPKPTATIPSRSSTPAPQPMATRPTVTPTPAPRPMPTSAPRWMATPAPAPRSMVPTPTPMSSRITTHAPLSTSRTSTTNRAKARR